MSKDYGVTATGLAKICDRHNIPRPPQGHWTKLEAGKQVEVTKLPKLGEGQREEFDITPPESKRKHSPIVEKAETDAANAVVGLEVLDEFNKLHPLVKGWVKQHREDQTKRRQERRERRREVWGSFWDPISDLTERDRYRFQATSTVFRALEKAGAKVVDAKITGKFDVKIGSHVLDCAIKEKMRQGLSDVDKSWSSYPDHHQHGLHSSGFLRIAVNTYAGGSRLEWIEKQHKKVIDLLPKITASIMACGPRLDELQAEREAQHLRYEEERRKQYEEQQRRELEARRWKHFREQAVSWQECERLRVFVDAIEHRMLTEQVDDIDGMTAAEWVAWTREKIEELDPMRRDLHGLWTPPSRW
ncbi:MAG: hypothetical protein AAFM92_10820 [Pseudomonadota bacterium]